MKIGDKVTIPADGKFHPERGHRGTCVWISKDGKTVAVQCEQSHGGRKDVVFQVKINSEK